MDQVCAGPAGDDTFEKQLPNCTATYSGYPDFAPQSPAKEKGERHSESLKTLLSALLSSSYYHLFPAVSCPGKPVISPEASLEMDRRAPYTCQYQRRKCSAEVSVVPSLERKERKGSSPGFPSQISWRRR